MRSILIDPWALTVKPHDYNGDWQTIAPTLGNGAELFEAVRFNDADDIVYVDEEGLFKPDKRFFKIPGFEQPLCGRGLLLGTDNKGDSVEPSFASACKTDEQWQAAVANVRATILFYEPILGGLGMALRKPKT